MLVNYLKPEPIIESSRARIGERNGQGNRHSAPRRFSDYLLDHCAADAASLKQRQYLNFMNMGRIGPSLDDQAADISGLVLDYKCDVFTDPTLEILPLPGFIPNPGLLDDVAHRELMQMVQPRIVCCSGCSKRDFHVSLELTTAGGQSRGVADSRRQRTDCALQFCLYRTSIMRAGKNAKRMCAPLLQRLLGLGRVANHFDVVPVRTNDESCIVVSVIVSAQTRRSIVLASRLQRRAIESVDLLAILGSEC